MKKIFILSIAIFVALTNYAQSFTSGNIVVFASASSNIPELNTAIANQPAVDLCDVPIIASVSNNSPACSGDTLTLISDATGSETLTYSWAEPNSFSSTSQNPSISNVTAAATGTYTVTVTNDCGSATATTTVAINVAPSSLIASSNSPVCAGTNINLALSASGSPTLRYSWAGPNGFTSPSQNPTVAVAVAGTYSVTATNSCGFATAITTVIVFTPPTSVATTSNSPVCSGANLSLSSSGSGSPTLSYSWAGPNGFTSASQNPTTSAVAGTYSVTVTNNCGHITAGMSVTIKVTPSFVTASGGGPNCAGADVNLNSSATGATSYSWSGPNSFTSFLQNPSITAVTTAASGIYIVTATNNNCSATATASVNIKSSSTSSQSATACSSYIWNGTTYTSSGDKAYSTLNAVGCDSVATLHLTINHGSLQTPFISGALSYCAGGSTTLSTDSFASYLWSPGGQTTQAINITSGGIYTVTVTNNSGLFGFLNCTCYSKCSSYTCHFG